ncbi:hypothetical protein QQ045_024164 [Rhodiola kirilowii]
MSMMMEVRVPNLDCEGCASKLRKALLKLKGVDEVEVDRDIKKITVMGYNLEERKVLKAIRLAGKAAEMWPFPGYSHHLAAFYKYPSHVINHYYHDMQAKHHDAEKTHSFFHTPAVYSVAVASDEALLLPFLVMTMPTLAPLCKTSCQLLLCFFIFQL